MTIMNFVILQLRKLDVGSVCKKVECLRKCVREREREKGAGIL